VVRFCRTVHTLKELPRHGFTVFGLKRSETDSFAGHGFATASLAYLLARELQATDAELDLHRVLLTALVHDLPVALTGDVSYDVQRSAPGAWRALEAEAMESLTEAMPALHAQLPSCLDDWNNYATPEACIAHAAAALDAWEMGVTTPSAWSYAWEDYLRRTVERIRDAGRANIATLSMAAARELAKFEPSDAGGASVGRSPEIRPIRLGP
jgi:5'-deoxynucleotidase YfbR-like HD superfamily hydrolase